MEGEVRNTYQEWLVAEGDRWRQEQKWHRRDEMNFGTTEVDLPDEADMNETKGDLSDGRSV
jgi:hypothetical protein